MQRPDLEPIRIRLAALAVTDGNPPWPLPDDLDWEIQGEAAHQFVAHAPADLAALVEHIEHLEGLLTQAWDKLPEGYTVLRGQILQAQGYRGCTWCGFVCVEHEAEVAGAEAAMAARAN